MTLLSHAETAAQDDGGETSHDLLDVLERAYQRFSDENTLVRCGGTVSEVSPTNYRVRGLSGVARLGHIVELRSRAGAKRGEIVQIGPKDVLVAPFDQTPEAGIGDPASIWVPSP